MKRQLRAEEARLWAAVAHTVRPAPGRLLPDIAEHPAPDEAGPETSAAASAVAATAPPKRLGPHRRSDLDAIEPGRRRRIARGRDVIEARLDLHGLDQDRARLTLEAFLHRAHRDGLRAALVITGKGGYGDGVLKRRTPEWLGEPALRPIVAGYSPAERHHGGEGAIYVALKRRSR